MKEIHKFKLEPVKYQVIKIPMGSHILSAGNQRETICIWAVVDPYEIRESKHTIGIYGTGWEMEGMPGRFIGTVLMDDGNLVFHVFEEDIK